MENIKKFLQLLMRHSLNSYWLVFCIIVIGFVQTNLNKGIFIWYVFVHGFILQKAYIEHLESKKKDQMQLFLKELEKITNKIEANYNTTINRFINLK